MSDQTEKIKRVENHRVFAYKRSIARVSTILVIFGYLALAFWIFTNDNSTMSMLIFLTGITILVIAVMLYIFSPSRYLREEIADALPISSLISLNRLLDALFIKEKGIYTAPGPKGVVTLFLPLSGNEAENLPVPGTGLLNVDGPAKGVSLQPPGFGIYAEAVKIGAVFSPETLDGTIKDVLENGLELAAKVSVKHGENGYTVELAGLVNKGLCDLVRREDSGICTRMGCPICSGVACMIADGTGRKVRITGVSVEGRIVKATYELTG